MPLKIWNPDVRGQNTEHDPAAGWVQIDPNSSHQLFIYLFIFEFNHLHPDLAPHFTTVGPAAASQARRHTARSNKTFSNPSGGGREVHNLADKRQKEQQKNRGGSVRILEIDGKKNP